MSKRNTFHAINAVVGLGLLLVFQNCGQAITVGDIDVPSNKILETGSPTPTSTPSETPTPAYTLQNRWMIQSSSGAPSELYGAASVWAMGKMRVFGGRMNSAAVSVFDPATNAWSLENSASAPAMRFAHSAIWTGSQVLVFGGNTGTIANPVTSKELFSYNINTQQWTSVAVPPWVFRRMNHSAIWTGSEMIVFGGFSQAGNNIGEYRADGFRYNPSNQSWSPLSTINSPISRLGASAVWTGSKMLLFGGLRHDGFHFVNLNDFYAYDPATNMWEMKTSPAAFSARFNSVAAWLGGKMVIYGGTALDATSAAPVHQGDAALFDPLTNVWTATSSTAALSARGEATGSSTGRSLLILGGVPAAQASQGFIKFD
jgi:N-acetylneuraminic acid mutarotase